MKNATHYRRTATSPWIYIGHLPARSISNFLRSGVYAAIKFEDGSVKDAA